MSRFALRSAFRSVAKIEMSPAARLVLLALANRHDQKTGLCDSSNAILRGDTQLSERTVRYALRELERLRLISTARGIGDPATCHMLKSGGGK